MKIYLIRHGHYVQDEGRGDGHLSLKGKEQIRCLTKRLISQEKNFNEVYSSPLVRAVESAREFCNVANIEEIIESNQLIEERSYEDVEDVVERMSLFLDDLKKQRKELAAIVSHSYAIKYFLNSFKRDVNRKILAHGGFVLLDYKGSIPRIVDYGSTSHLKGMESY